MPCGGINPCRPVKGARCYQCGSGEPEPDHFVEEWDAYMHADCVAPFLRTFEGQCVLVHGHEVVVAQPGDPEPRYYRPGPKQHALKCWPESFAAIKAGVKTFDYRQNDRGFLAGDTLLLRCWDPKTQRYGGQEITMKVQYVAFGPDYGIAEGFCCMSLVPLRDVESEAT